MQMHIAKTPYAANYRPEIDGLRTVAVLSVLLFHLKVAGFSGGFVGVDIFFVISGFLITRNIYLDHEKGTWSLKRFYIRRARRILPALLFMLAMTSVVAAWLMWPPHLVNYARSLIYSCLGASNLLFMNEAGYFDISSHYKPLLHTWSLAVEEQYYLIWPLALVFMLNFNRKTGIFLLIAVNIMALVACGKLIRSHQEIAFYMMPFRIPEFSLGAAAFFLSRWQIVSRWPREVIAAIGACCIAWAIHRFSEHMHFPGVSALLPCIGTALIILMAQGSALGILLRNRISVRLGLLSYSLYLMHWPLIILYTYHFYGNTSDIPLTVSEKVGMTAASILMAEGMYRYIETPFRKRPHPIGLPDDRVYLASCAGIAALLIVAATVIIHSHGWPQRMRLDMPAGNDEREMSVRFHCTHEPDQTLSCNFGASAPNASQLLLIGDSHTEGLRSLFDRLGKDNNIHINFLMAPACGSLFGITELIVENGVKKVDEKCTAARKKWEEMVLNPKVKVVAMASRWDFYVSPNIGVYLVKNVNDVLDAEHLEPVFEKTLLSTVAQIVAHGKKVILFSQAPFHRQELKDCFNHLDCRVPLESITDNNNDFIEDTVKKIARIYPQDVYPVILSDYFCPRKDHYCYVIKDKKLLYEDGGHINAYGGDRIYETLPPSFRSFFSHAFDAKH